MPLKNAQQISTILRPHVQANNASIAPSDLVTMYLGDGQGNTRPTTLITARDVFVRSDQSQNDRGVAVLDPSFPIPIDAIDGFYDTPVICAKKPRSNYLYVIELADGTGATLPNGAMPTDALIRQSGFPSQDRFVIFRLGPSLVGGLSINIDLGIYAVSVPIGGGLYDFVQSVDLDLSDPTNPLIYVPVSTALASGKHRIVAIAESPLDGKYIAIAGAAVTAANTLGTQDARSEFSEDDYKAINLTGYVPCGYVYQYYGQTEFAEDDCLRLYDPRQFLRPNGLERWGTTAVSADYTMLSTDSTLLVDTGSARAITLSPAANYPLGLAYLVKDSTGTASTHNITITPDGSETIDGDATKVINTNWGAIVLIPVVGGWITVAIGAGATVTSIGTKFDAFAPPSSPSSYDDEFDDNAIAGAWTEFDIGNKYTYSEDERGLLQVGTGISGDSVSGLYKTLPAGNFTIDCYVSITGGVSGSIAVLAGIMLLEGSTSTSNALIHTLRNFSSTNTVSAYDHTAYNAGGTAKTQFTLGPGVNGIFLRLRRNSTNYYYDFSIDGILYYNLTNTTISFTPALFGIGGNFVSQNTTTAYARYQYFRYTGSDIGMNGILGGRRAGIYV